jgi:hypothetical protein
VFRFEVLPDRQAACCPAGSSIAAVTGWLGHASPTVTLATYAHMMPVDEDRARAVIAAALRAPVSQACHDGTDG